MSETERFPFARMILDSISKEGYRVSTMHLRYWRPIHSELMTHRVFSRNARSSRAVPSITLLAEDIFIPQFGVNQKGMQSEEAASVEQQEQWAEEWEELASITRRYVRKWSGEKMHKQWANRPLEWFGWIDVLVSSTDWENFWSLRRHSAAQPELQALADMMFQAMEESKPQLLMPGEWHLPYISKEEREQHMTDTLLKLSTARCARLSYKPFDGSSSIEAEITRHNLLVGSQPVHASPAEHQAYPDRFIWPDDEWERLSLHGNLQGWVQYRKTLPYEQTIDIRG